MATITLGPQAYVKDGTIYLWSPKTEDNVARCRAVPGGHWNHQRNAWTYPATPELAQALRDMWQAEGLVTDANFTRLLAGERPQPSRTMLAAPTGQATTQEEDEKEEEPPIPHLNKEGWQHQRRAYRFAQGLFDAGVPGAMLALGMGTGKSLVTVALIEADRQAGGNTDPVLILAPKSVLAAWGGAPQRPGQFAAHLPQQTYDRYQICLLNDDRDTVAVKTHRAAQALSDASHSGRRAVVIIGYEAGRLDAFAEWASKIRWGFLVLDESHRLKASGGITANFAEKVSRRSRRRLLLTGTPMPHDHTDIYAQYRALDPSVFGTNFNQFRLRYSVMGGFQGRQVVAVQREEELHSKIYSRAIRIGAEVLDLPPYHHLERRFRLSPKARRAYDDLQRKLVAELEIEAQGGAIVTVANALVKLLRLAQITGGNLPTDDGLVVHIDDGKEALLEDWLEDLDPKEPVVVFARFSADLAAIHRAAHRLGRGSVELSGARHELEAWQNDTAAKTPILAVQEQSGGVGIDLTRSGDRPCRYMVLYSVGFSLGNYEQSLARVHRPGQTETVTYLHLLAEATVDEYVYQVLAERKEVIEGILDQMRRRITAA